METRRVAHASGLINGGQFQFPQSLTNPCWPLRTVPRLIDGGVYLDSHRLAFHHQLPVVEGFVLAGQDRAAERLVIGKEGLTLDPLTVHLRCGNLRFGLRQ